MIEFYRFMFAVNFVIVHGLMVIPIGYLKGFPLFVSALDIIVPFMAFSGYFMMVALGEVISFALGYALMQFDQKKLQFSLKKKFF